MAQSRPVNWPPVVELVPPGSDRFLVVCYDLEATGLDLEDEIIQIGAFSSVQEPTFSCYILPLGRSVHREAEGIIGLQVQVAPDGGRALYDTRQDAVLPTVDERTGLLLFLDWLKTAAESWEGAVLVSHGAVCLDIPLLLTAIERHELDQQFFEVVKGFCDSFAIFTEKKAKMRRSLQGLYTSWVGPRDENHRAPEDARDLHTLLLKYYHTDFLSLSLESMARYTYSSQCMVQYVHWKRSCELTKLRLGLIVETWKGKGKKIRNVLLKNLMAAGYDYETLEAEYKSLGRVKFRVHLTKKLETMKKSYESYLTDTADVSTGKAVERVIQYFAHVPQ